MASSDFLIHDGTKFIDVFHGLKAKFGLPLPPDEITLDGVGQDAFDYFNQTKFLLTYGRRNLAAAVREFENFANLDNLPEETVSKAPGVQSSQRRQIVIQKRRIRSFNQELKKQLKLFHRDGGSIVTDGNSRQSAASVNQIRPATATEQSSSYVKPSEKHIQKVLDWQDRNRSTSLVYTRLRDSREQHLHEHDEGTFEEAEVGQNPDEEIHEAFPDIYDYVEEPTEMDIEVDESGLHVASKNYNWGTYKAPDVEIGPPLTSSKKPSFNSVSSLSKSFPPPPPPSSTSTARRLDMEEEKKRKRAPESQNKLGKTSKNSSEKMSDRPTKRQSPLRQLGQTHPAATQHRSISAGSSFGVPQPPNFGLQENTRPPTQTDRDRESFSTVATRKDSFESNNPFDATQPTSFNSNMEGKVAELETMVPPINSHRNGKQPNPSTAKKTSSAASKTSRPIMRNLRQHSPPTQQLLRESENRVSSGRSYSSVGESTLRGMLDLDAPSERATSSGHAFQLLPTQSVQPPPVMEPQFSPTPSPQKSGCPAGSPPEHSRARDYKLYNTLVGTEPFPGDHHGDIFDAEGAPFWLRYEATRIILATSAKEPQNYDLVSQQVRVLINEFQKTDIVCYDQAKQRFKDIILSPFKADELYMVDPIKPDAFSAVYNSKNRWDNRLQVAAELIFPDKIQDPETRRSVCRPTIRLLPLQVQSMTHRFSRKYGSDRFMMLRLPRYQSSMKVSHRSYKEIINGFLIDSGFEVLGRHWRLMYYRSSTKNANDKRIKLRKKDKESIILIMFAESGDGIAPVQTSEAIEWFIPLNDNLRMTQCKFWSRISLGFSTTNPTVVFESHQIIPLDDIKAGDNSLTDGCGLVSPAVLRRVKEILGLNYVPSAVQARIGAAKGLWIADPSVEADSEEIWIKIRGDQKKFNGITSDEAHLTLDICDVSRELRPTALNLQFIVILLQNGVPYEVLAELLREDIGREIGDFLLSGRLDDPIFLRGYLERVKANASRRGGTLAVRGKLPMSLAERSILLLDSGFTLQNATLKKWFHTVLTDHCEDIQQKMHIGIPQSCSAFCVPDPSGKLKKGEVYLRFSQRNFVDSKTMLPLDILRGDILVGRNPAHFASDIQRVTAVDVPELRHLTDVIVFSADPKTCERSLADYLSGGDYDGDRIWTCWDSRVVDSYQNQPYGPATVAGEMEHHIEVNTKKMLDIFRRKVRNFQSFTNFLKAQIEICMQEERLGLCTTFFEKFVYTYHGCPGGSINHKDAKLLAAFCGKLVDAPKHGYSFREGAWEVYDNLYKKLNSPFYKEKRLQGAELERAKKSDHPINMLKFHVARAEIDLLLEAFQQNSALSETSYKDADLTRYYDRTRTHYEEQKRVAEKDPTGLDSRRQETALSVLQQLNTLNSKLDKLCDKWRDFFGGRDLDSPDEKDQTKFGNFVESCTDKYDEILPVTDGTVSLPTGLVEHWDFNARERYSDWALLKASALHIKLSRRTDANSQLPWYVAADAYCHLKARAMPGTVRSITESMTLATKIKASAMVKVEQSIWVDGGPEDLSEEVDEFGSDE
ncbi:hypothetical protein ABW20_dc0108908 [Dactylellina cionopaga]|nr:hypothetical protein ABW20_dc0108908 [Dactylellina cionopaga]